MPATWFFAPYRRRQNRTLANGVVQAIRYCAIDDYTPQIVADGGWWAFTGVLGSQCIVKVRASLATLLLIVADVDIQRLPMDRLDDPLSTLTLAQKTALRDHLLAQGYTLAQINNRFPGDLGDYTLRDVLRFSASRVRRERYDAASDAFVEDGTLRVPTDPDDVDLEV